MADTTDGEPKKAMKEELEDAAESLESAAEKAWEMAQTSGIDRPPESNKDARTWGLIAHLSPLATSMVIGLPFVGPLVVWLIKKDEMPFVADQAKEALNFSIITSVVGIALVILGFCTGGIGWLLLPVLGLVALILHILAAVAANEGKWYRYPFNVRLIT